MYEKQHYIFSQYTRKIVAGDATFCRCGKLTFRKISKKNTEIIRTTKEFKEDHTQRREKIWKKFSSECIRSISTVSFRN